MKSSTTSDFWRPYASLPPEVKHQARKAWRLWRENPRHSSLRFARKGSYRSVRVSRGWRALGREHEGTLYWFWIGRDSQKWSAHRPETLAKSLPWLATIAALGLVEELSPGT